MPRTERLLEAIEVFGFQLRLRKCLPSIRIIWSDRDNALAQLHDRGLVRSFFGRFKLRLQLRNLLVRAQQRTTDAQ